VSSNASTVCGPRTGLPRPDRPRVIRTSIVVNDRWLTGAGLAPHRAVALSGSMPSERIGLLARGGGEGPQEVRGNQPVVLTFGRRIVRSYLEAVMRNATLFAVGVAILVNPALAQKPRDTNSRSSLSEASRAVSGQSSSSASPAGSRSDSPGPPIDQGPVSPEANQAHRGGGAVLEGAPGAPAPMPQPTPSHDTPSPR
jgi:hypothetical protein